MTKPLEQWKVKEVMSKDVVVVHPDDTLREALDLIVENRVAALPVVNGRGHCVGILSTSDLIDLTHDLDDELQHLGRGSGGGGGHEWLIEQLASALGTDHVSSQMSPDVAAIDAEASLAEAAACMLRNHVHRLPVVDRKQKLLGIVSTMDVMNVVANSVLRPAAS